MQIVPEKRDWVDTPYRKLGKHVAVQGTNDLGGVGSVSCQPDDAGCCNSLWYHNEKMARQEQPEKYDVLAFANTSIDSWHCDAGQTNPMHRYVGVDIS